MDSGETPFLETSAVSLHERFSQVLVDRLTWPRTVTFDHGLRQQRRVCGPRPGVLQVQTRALSLRVKQPWRRRRRRRRSVWTRLGWQQVTHRLSASRPRGFWSFRNKYKWRARFTPTYRGRGGPGQHRLLMRRRIQIPTGGPTQLRTHLQRGGATVSWGCGLRKEDLPTRKQLDAQLDDYMSMSKSNLDKQLDEYMSMSKSRLDAELDEYMSMAGQAHWD